MALKFITAEEAASYVHHNDNVGFSGFTPAGCPKVVPGAIARKAAEEHAKGNPFQIGMFTGASTGDKLDGELARANAIKFRTPYQSNKDLRAALNAHQAQYFDLHLSCFAVFALRILVSISAIGSLIVMLVSSCYSDFTCAYILIVYIVTCFIINLVWTYDRTDKSADRLFYLNPVPTRKPS